jgi:uncharacterized membrane protein
MDTLPASDEKLGSLKTLATIIYALYAVSLFFGVTAVIAIVLNYIKREDVQGTWLESHFRWQIRTFWYALLWVVAGTLLSLPLMLVLVGFATMWLVLVGVGLWVLYRVVRGWMRLASGRPMYT